MNPEFPVYIVSRHRWQWARRLTTRNFETTGVPYRIIVEADEADDYADAVGRERILVLDPAYQRDYDARCALVPDESRGSGPARNFAWDHAQAAGAPWHWVVDDNISCFYRMVENQKIQFGDGAPFRLIEEFTLRYENVALAGPNYDFFHPRHRKRRPITPNSRVYSCILIRTDLPYRWRCRYNEDTDLSLRVLKDGWCTLLFNTLLQKKAGTQSVPGGNTDSIYVGGTFAKSQMLVQAHPDVTRLILRWGRWHHYVDYRRFAANRLRLRPGLVLPETDDEHGLTLIPRQPLVQNWRKSRQPKAAAHG